MTFEEYFALSLSIRERILQLERLEEIRKGEEYRKFEAFAGKAGAIGALPAGILLTENLGEKRARLLRLYGKYLKKLARACEMIPQAHVKEYAVRHYLYGLTNEAIAEQTHYAARTVYRHALIARREMKKNLLLFSPKCRRVQEKRFFPAKESRAVLQARRLKMEWKRRAPKRHPNAPVFRVCPERAFTPAEKAGSGTGA